MSQCDKTSFVHCTVSGSGATNNFITYEILM